MIEPPETESKETLDAFVEAMLAIAREAEDDPALVREAPHTTRLGRLDEVEASRGPRPCWGQAMGTGSKAHFSLFREEAVTAHDEAAVAGSKLAMANQSTNMAGVFACPHGQFPVRSCSSAIWFELSAAEEPNDRTG